MSVASAVCNLSQEWTQIASNDERVLLRLLTPTPGNPAPTVMGHYCLQNAARRVHGSAQAHPSAGLPLPLPCPCIQDLPRPTRAEHLASRLQPDKPRGYRFHARTAHHSHRRRHPLLQPRRHQLLQHHPHALPCPKKSLWHAPPVRPRCAPTSPALPALAFMKPGQSPQRRS